jgi:hypothetical protein
VNRDVFCNPVAGRLWCLPDHPCIRLRHDLLFLE